MPVPFLFPHSWGIFRVTDGRHVYLPHFGDPARVLSGYHLTPSAMHVLFFYGGGGGSYAQSGVDVTDEATLKDKKLFDGVTQVCAVPLERPVWRACI